MHLEGSLKEKLWRIGMLVERGYTSTSQRPHQRSRSQSIISSNLATHFSTPLTRARTGGEQRARGGTRSTIQAAQTLTHKPSGTESPEIVATNQQPQVSAEIPESNATGQQPNNVTTPIAGQEDATEVDPEIGEWANLAGDARRTGEGGGPAQCTIAAARNASRNKHLTHAQFRRWCMNEDILAPHWCSFLQDCCARAGEKAVPIDKILVRHHGHEDIRIAILQLNAGRHAVAIIRAASGAFRRYDNDDEARMQGTFNWSTWSQIMHEWDSNGIAMFGIVPTDSPHTSSRRATETKTRDARRKRVDELIRAGVHNHRDRQRILRAEDTINRQGDHHSDDTADSQLSPPRNAPPNREPQTTRATKTGVGTNLPMMRAFLPSTLSQTGLPSAIQMLGLPNADLREMGGNDIVMAPFDTQPHNHHQARQRHHTRGKAEHIETSTPSTVRPTAGGSNASAPAHTNPSITVTPITTATQTHSHIQPYPQPHPQRNEETEAMRRQLQQTPQHAPSENHPSLQCVSEIVRPSTTQSHPQPPHSTAQAEMLSPQRIAADNPDAGQEQLLRNGNVHLDTSRPIVQHRPARASLQENDDVTHENPSSSFHIEPQSPQISNPLLPLNIQNPLTRLTPNLLACTRILSGRNLLTMSDITRFARPIFDPLAFLLEHVCEPSHVPVKIRPCDLRPALAKQIHSAMTLTPDGFVAAMTTHPPTPAGRPRFAYHIPECSLPNSHTVPGTLPFEIVSPLHISGGMGRRYHYCIYAVVPCSSPLASLGQPPPPYPPPPP